VLEARLPDVAVLLFDRLEPSEGVAAVAGVPRFLDRIAALREGKANGLSAETARAAIELLATRKILDATRESELRTLIATVQQSARPEEVVAALPIDARRDQVTDDFIRWLHEWREVARLAIARRDYLISLGLAQRRKKSEADAEEVPGTALAG
jgi:hypothetical protein